MKLKLKFMKSASPLIEFLANFKRLGDSLLLEFDVPNQRFAAKALCGNGEVDTFRFSYLPFEACGVVATTNDPDNIQPHVYHGLLNYLGKVIEIVKMAEKIAVYSETDGNGNTVQKCGLTLEVDYEPDTAYCLFDDEEVLAKTGQHVPQELSVLSSSKMTVITKRSRSTVRAFRLKHFKTLTDEQYSTVIAAVDPTCCVKFDIDENTLDYINKVSEIFRSPSDGKVKDFIVFNINNGEISVSNLSSKDQENNESGSILVASGLNTDGYPSYMQVRKEWFRKNITKGAYSWGVTIGPSPLGAIDRICMEATDTETGVVTSVTLSDHIDGE